MPGERITDGVSVADLISRMGGEDAYLTCAKIYSPDSTEEFLETLHTEIDYAITLMTQGANHYEKDSEETLSHHLVNLLKQRGYTAEAETDARGHVDVLIRPAKPRTAYRWLGEAKIHHSYEYLFDGLKQLLSRYSDGVDPEGGLIVYVRAEKANVVLKRWQKHIQDHKQDVWMTEVSDAGTLRLKSLHDHQVSGLLYGVRHIFAPMYYKPIDKSGREALGKEAKKRAKKKSTKEPTS